MIIILLALSLTSMGCLIGNQATKSRGVFYIGYLISANGSGSYIIDVPVPTLDNGSISPIIDNLKITSGGSKYYIVDTQFGRCLRIESNRSVFLENSGYKAYSPINFSTQKGSEIGTQKEAWFYYNNSKYNGNITVYFRIKAYQDNTGIKIYSDNNPLLKNGWNLYPYEQQEYPGPT